MREARQVRVGDVLVMQGFTVARALVAEVTPAGLVYESGLRESWSFVLREREHRDASPIAPPNESEGT